MNRVKRLSVIIFVLVSLAGCSVKTNHNNEVISDDRIICSWNHIAYINENNSVNIIFDNGTTRVIFDDIRNITKIFGDENDIVAVTDKGKVLIYDIENDKHFDDATIQEYLNSWQYEDGSQNNYTAYMKKLKELLVKQDVGNGIFMNYPFWYACTYNNGNNSYGINWSDSIINEINSIDGIKGISSIDSSVYVLDNEGNVISVVDGETGVEKTTVWNNIQSIVQGRSIFALDVSGKVYSSFEGGDEDNVSNWKNIQQISASSNITVGLDSNNHVLVACGDDSIKQSTKEWNNIVYVVAAEDYVLGIKEDGSMVIAYSKNRSSTFNIDTNTSGMTVNYPS